MKKLRLKALSLGAREILSREQLKGINGGCVNSLDCSDGMRCVNGGCQNVGSDYHPSDPFSGSTGGGSGTENCFGMIWCEISHHCVMWAEECAD